MDHNKVMESVTENFPTKKSRGPGDFTGEFYQIFKQILTTILKLSQKTKRKGENTS